MNEDLTCIVVSDVLSSKVFGTHCHVSVNDQKVCYKTLQKQFILNILLGSSHQGPRIISHTHSQLHLTGQLKTSGWPSSGRSWQGSKMQLSPSAKYPVWPIVEVFLNLY